MLSVFLVDDEYLIKRGLRKLIQWEELGFKICGEASDGEEALEFITADNTDVVITDLKMPAMDGLELAAMLKERFPGIKVIVLTGFDDFNYMQQSIRNSVFDYLLKPVNADLLTETLMKIKAQVENESYEYPFMLETQLISQIQQLNEKEIFIIIDDLFDKFQKNKVPFHIAKDICENMLVKINLILDGTGCNLNDILGIGTVCDDHFRNAREKNEIRDEMVKILNSIIQHKSRHGNRKITGEIKEYIENHLYEDINLTTIAAKFYLNPSYLSQLFKNETGENYVDFLMRVKIEKAKKLLKDKNLRIQEISELVGYTDSKYFGQLFKKQVGILPSEYRIKVTK
jgi:two-component system response regulator YesN